MNEILRNIRRRRSVFPHQFTDQNIPEIDLEMMLQMANYAPNHRKTEPWRFFVFKGRKKNELAQYLVRIYKKITSKEEFSEEKSKKIANRVHQSPVVVVICVNISGLVPEWEEIAAVSMAVQNMWLGATSCGYAGYWSTPGLKDYMQDFLSLQPNQKCLGFFYLGVPKEEPSIKEKANDEKIQIL